MSTEVPMALPSTLRRWISDVTVLTTGGPDDCQALVHAPDADTSLVFRMTSARHSDLIVIGPRTHASYYVGKDLPLCLKIRLRPGAARLLLGVPASELVDRVISLGELWPRSEALTIALAGSAADPQLVLKHLEAAFLTRITAQTAADLTRSELVQAAASDLTGHLGQRPQSVPAIARRLAISERHLRNLFSDCIGLSPKHFERISRVRGVLARGRGGTSRWAQLAATAGYYDQSHMTAEFRTMMGVPPAAFFAGHLPPFQPC
jgi:AraC-like DNA-binding protein